MEKYTKQVIIIWLVAVLFVAISLITEVLDKEYEDYYYSYSREEILSIDKRGELLPLPPTSLWDYINEFFLFPIYFFLMPILAIILSGIHVYKNPSFKGFIISLAGPVLLIAINAIPHVIDGRFAVPIIVFLQGVTILTLTIIINTVLLLLRK